MYEIVCNKSYIKKLNYKLPVKPGERKLLDL